MKKSNFKTSFKTSKVTDKCQICRDEDLKSVLFLGYLPPVNQMRTIGSKPHEQSSYPAGILYCPSNSSTLLLVFIPPFLEAYTLIEPPWVGIFLA